MNYLKKRQEKINRDKRIISALTKTNGKGQSELARKLGMSRQLVSIIWKKYGKDNSATGS